MILVSGKIFVRGGCRKSDGEKPFKNLSCARQSLFDKYFNPLESV